MVIWVALGATIPLAAAALVLAWTASQRPSPAQCPTCQAPLDLVAPADDEHGYAVLACSRCANAATRVQPPGAQFARCPACDEPALDTPAARVGPGGSIEVRERCRLCDFHQVRRVGEDRSPGRIIPFPSGGRRRRTGSEDPSDR